MIRALAALLLFGLVAGPARAELSPEDIYRLMQLSPEQLRARIEDGLDPNAMAAGDPLLIRVMVEARTAQQQALIDVLLENGADVNAPGQFAQTPFLHLLTFGVGSTKETRTLIERFLAEGARLDFVADVDFDGDGTPEMPGQLGLSSVMAAAKSQGSGERVLMALELGAGFPEPTTATFATPFFYAATAQDDGALASAFLEAGAEPCFFPAAHADRPVTMIDGVTRPQTAVWEIQWQGALELGLQERLKEHPEIFARLAETGGICPSGAE